MIIPEIGAVKALDLFGDLVGYQQDALAHLQIRLGGTVAVNGEDLRHGADRRQNRQFPCIPDTGFRQCKH